MGATAKRMERAMAGRTTAEAGGRGMTFYVGMALAFALAAFIGFAPTYYLKSVFAAPPLSSIVHLHGIVFTAWLAVLLTQTLLVARGRTDLHRRLGIAGVTLAAAMLVLGLVVAVASAARGFAPPNAPPPLSFLAIPFFSLVAFAGLVGAGFILRGTPDAHKRLMILATVPIIEAAMARFPLPVAVTPPVFFALADLFVIAAVIRDYATRGRLHPATLWGGLWVLAWQPIRLMVLGTGPWLDFARWLVTWG